METDKGLCPLAQAIIYVRIELASVLMAHGADAMKHDVHGLTVVEVIAKHTRGGKLTTKLAEQLRELGIDTEPAEERRRGEPIDLIDL
jgi:hypothetical protein